MLDLEAGGMPPIPKAESKLGLSDALKLEMKGHLKKALSLGTDKFIRDINEEYQRDVEEFEKKCEERNKV